MPYLLKVDKMLSIFRRLMLVYMAISSRDIVVLKRMTIHWISSGIAFPILVEYTSETSDDQVMINSGQNVKCGHKCHRVTLPLVVLRASMLRLIGSTLLTATSPTFIPFSLRGQNTISTIPVVPTMLPHRNHTLIIDPASAHAGTFPLHSLRACHHLSLHALRSLSEVVCLLIFLMTALPAPARSKDW
jgi:hypothetical protein